MNKNPISKRIDIDFFPAKVNLAMLYNRMGKNAEAELLLKDVILGYPEMGDIHYSLGLLLAEMQKYSEAIQYLKNAAELLPANGRIFYNLGQLQDFVGDTITAETSLIAANTFDPEAVDIQIALIDFYLKHKQFEKAKLLALRYKKSFPDDQSIDQVIDYINNQFTNK